MEKSRKSVLRKNRILKIILSSVIAIAMTSFYMIGSSADSVVYLNKTISGSDFAALAYSNSTVRYGYSDLSNQPYLSLMGTVEGTYRITYDQLPYTAQGYVSGSSLYWESVIFTNNSEEKRIVYNISPLFEFYFDDFTFEFYMLMPDNYNSFSVQYLDSESNLVTVESTKTVIATNSLFYLKSDYPSLIDDNYFNYVYNNSFYTDINGNNTSYTYGLTRNTSYSLVKYSCNFTGLDKTQIISILISVTYSRTISNGTYPRIAPYIFFNSSISAFIKSSQDEVYTQQLALAQAQNEMLQEITGDPDPVIQNEIDQAQSEQEQALQDLQDNVDTINEPTMPPEAELPTAPLDSEEAEEVYEDINTVFNLDGLNLFNILVPTGCVGFLIFTVMRRF